MNALTLALFFLHATKGFNLPENLLSGLCYVESAHKIHAVHKDDGNGTSLGVCQVKLETAKMLGFKGSEKELMEPNVNIYYSAKYLRNQLTRYNGDIVKAVAAYNSGSYKENKKHTPVNQLYVNKVFNAWVKKK